MRTSMSLNTIMCFLAMDRINLVSIVQCFCWCMVVWSLNSCSRRLSITGDNIPTQGWLMSRDDHGSHWNDDEYQDDNWQQLKPELTTMSQSRHEFMNRSLQAVGWLHCHVCYWYGKGSISIYHDEELSITPSTSIWIAYYIVTIRPSCGSCIFHYTYMYFWSMM